MIAFALAATLMLGAAMVFLLPPLLRRRGPKDASRGDVNLAVHRHQLDELEADVRSGTLSAAQFDESKRELERRILEDVPSSARGPAVGAGAAHWTALTIAVLVPIVAGLLYWHLGTPQGLLPEAESTVGSPHGPGHPMSADQMDVLVERLAARLAREPGDAQGWTMLARSYNALGRQAEAAAAFSKAVALAPGDAQLLADYADALAVTQAGRLDGEPMKIVRRALKVDPDNVKALALAGTDAFNRSDYRGAAGYWQRAVRATPDDSEFAASLRASLAEATALASGRPLPSADDLARQVQNAAAGAQVSAAAGRVAGRVTLSPALARHASPSDTVFVFARAAQGPRMPLAMITRRVKDLPLEFVLDDASSMSPAMKISSFDHVVVAARVSKSGTAEAHPGDLEGTSGPIAVGTAGVRVEIDRTLR